MRYLAENTASSQSDVMAIIVVIAATATGNIRSLKTGFILKKYLFFKTGVFNLTTIATTHAIRMANMLS